MPLDFEACEPELEVVALAPLQTVQQLEPPEPHSSARGEAATRISPHRNKQSAPDDTATTHRLHNSSTKEPRTNRKRRSKGKPSRLNKVDDMTVQRQGVYLAPHLRKRAAVLVTPKTDVKLGDAIAIGSPPASVKSQPKGLVQVQPSS